MIIRTAALALALAAAVAGCGAAAPAHHAALAANSATTTVTPATPVAGARASRGPEARICRRFRGDLPAILEAVLHHRRAALFRYQSRLARWSRPFTAPDARFARYLAAAGTELETVAAPAGARYEQQAAADLGHVNGYCQDNVGVQMNF
jgi:hypothetical protein